jgi:hypothetical protein
MSKNAANLWSPSAYALWTAPFGTTLPTTLLANPGAAWYEIGVLSDAGIAETRNVNENKIYDMVGQLQRIIRNQEERPFTFTALEDNRAVRELRYPGSTLATAAGTAEVQSLTVTATGGTIQPLRRLRRRDRHDQRDHRVGPLGDGAADRDPHPARLLDRHRVRCWPVHHHVPGL